MPLHHVIRPVLALTVFLAAAAPALATQTTVSGYFDDPANTALVSSNGYGDLGPAQFAPDGDIARNVAVYQLVVPVDGSAIRFVSNGYAAGGAQPYFSIFSGGDASATFLDSSYFDWDYDFSMTETLASGTYLFTIGVYENESIAENQGPPYGSLSEGFTALGVPDYLGNAFYQVGVTSDGADFTVAPATLLASANPPNPNGVPEPALIALFGAGLAAAGVHRRRGVNAASARLRASPPRPPFHPTERGMSC